MKIDIKKPSHWLLLCGFSVNVLIAITLRPLFFRARQKPAKIILYGHKLSGNLRAIQRAMRQNHANEFTPVFLTMDPRYHKQLVHEKTSSVWIISPKAISLLVTASALISDHGVHAIKPMLLLSNLKLFDVWHGIPFKGFDAKTSAYSTATIKPGSHRHSWPNRTAIDLTSTPAKSRSPATSAPMLGLRQAKHPG